MSDLPVPTASNPQISSDVVITAEGAALSLPRRGPHNRRSLPFNQSVVVGGVGSGSEVHIRLGRNSRYALSVRILCHVLKPVAALRHLESGLPEAVEPAVQQAANVIFEGLSFQDVQGSWSDVPAALLQELIAPMEELGFTVMSVTLLNLERVW